MIIAYFLNQSQRHLKTSHCDVKRFRVSCLWSISIFNCAKRSEMTISALARYVNWENY